MPAHRRLSGVPGHGGPEESPGPPRRDPAAPLREEPLTWRVISDLIFCMMAPPPPRLRSAAAQDAGARRSHVGRHLTAPARGSLGAVVPAGRPDYKPRQRGREGGQGLVLRLPRDGGSGAAAVGVRVGRVNSAVRLCTFRKGLSEKTKRGSVCGDKLEHARRQGAFPGCPGLLRALRTKRVWPVHG